MSNSVSKNKIMFMKFRKWNFVDTSINEVVDISKDIYRFIDIRYEVFIVTKDDEYFKSQYLQNKKESFILYSVSTEEAIKTQKFSLFSLKNNTSGSIKYVILNVCLFVKNDRWQLVVIHIPQYKDVEFSNFRKRNWDEQSFQIRKRWKYFRFHIANSWFPIYHEDAEKVTRFITDYNNNLQSF